MASFSTNWDEMFFHSWGRILRHRLLYPLSENVGKELVPVSVVFFKIVLSSFSFLSLLSPDCCKFLFSSSFPLFFHLCLLYFLKKRESLKFIYRLNSSQPDSAFVCFFILFLSLNQSFNVLSMEPETCHPPASTSWKEGLLDFAAT